VGSLTYIRFLYGDDAIPFLTPRAWRVLRLRMRRPAGLRHTACRRLGPGGGLPGGERPAAAWTSRRCPALCCALANKAPAWRRRSPLLLRHASALRYDRGTMSGCPSATVAQDSRPGLSSRTLVPGCA